MREREGRERGGGARERGGQRGRERERGERGGGERDRERGRDRVKYRIHTNRWLELQEQQ